MQPWHAQQGSPASHASLTLAAAFCMYTVCLLFLRWRNVASKLQQVVDFGLSTWLGFEGREDSSAEVGQL